MKKILAFICFILFLVSCAEDDQIGEIPALTPEYVLPQGKSPADDRIVGLYNKYGTYVLYDYTDMDISWLQVDVNNVWNGYTYTLPDPQYAGEMLDFLEESWFRFYPEEFHQKFMPYKIFLTSTLKYESDYDQKVTEYFVRITQTQIVISYCSDTLRKMSVATKNKFKNTLQAELWGIWLSEFSIPREFYGISNYNTVASNDPDAWNYARKLGFVADSKGNEWSTQDPWPNNRLNETSDLYAFLSGMRNRTSAQWSADLQYPLIKKKYDILRNYFLENYGFDIQEIGNSN